jgi:hypothetical protein
LKKEFTFRIIEIEAWLGTIGIQTLWRTIEPPVIHFGYPTIHLVRYGSEAIHKMCSCDNITADISERLHIANVKEEYPSAKCKMVLKSELNNLATPNSHTNSCRGSQIVPDRLNAKGRALRCSETTSLVFLKGPDVVKQNPRLFSDVCSCLQNPSKSKQFECASLEAIRSIGRVCECIPVHLEPRVILSRSDYYNAYIQSYNSINYLLHTLI